MRGYRAVTAVIAATVIVAAGTHLGGQGSSPARVGGAGAGQAETANLWVDTDGGTCTRNASAVSYATASACSGIGLAYAAASCGDTIIVKAGTYGGNSGEVVDNVAGLNSCGTNVTIKAATGESVILGNNTNHTGGCATNTSNVDICGAHLTLDGMKNATTMIMHEGANNDTIQNWTTGYSIYIHGVTGLLMQNSYVGGFSSGGGAGDGIHLQLANGNASCNAGSIGTSGCKHTSATFDHVRFGPITKTVDLTAHTDCLQTEEFTSLTITNSTFTNCPDAPIIIGGEGQFGTASTLLIRNNFVGPGTSSGNGVQMSDSNLANVSNNWTFEYNTVTGGNQISIGPLVEHANILPSLTSFACTQFGTQSITLTYNLLPSGSTQCGATNTVASGAIGFANTSADPIDLHIGAGSPACGVGDAGSFPATDIDGNSRSNPPPAGADGVC